MNEGLMSMTGTDYETSHWLEKKSAAIQFAQQVLSYNKRWLQKENLNLFTLSMKMETACYMY